MSVLTPTPALICSDKNHMKTIDDFNAGVSAFNNLYSNYQTQNCSTKIKDTKTNFSLTGLDVNNFVNNPSSAPTISTNCKVLTDSLIKYATEIDKARKDIQFAITKNVSDYKHDQQFTNYISDSDNLKARYRSLTTNRQELDMNMQQLLGYDNSVLYEKQGMIDSSVYTTLLWTVLATSVLYYTFTKL